METQQSQMIPLADIKIRPDINILPPLDADERIALTADIERTGRIRDALTLWKDGEENVLIDGHNRFQIASDLGLTEAPALFENFIDLEAVHSWIFTNQIARRNLNLFARIRLALMLEGPLKIAAAERKKASLYGADPDDQKLDTPVDQKGSVLSLLAKKVNASHDTVNKVRQIINLGSPKLRESVGLGDVSINRAAQIAIDAPNDPERQKDALDRLVVTDTLEKPVLAEELATAESTYIDGVTDTYKFKKCIIQFAKKDDGALNYQDCIIGDESGKYGGNILKGTTVRVKDRKISVVDNGFLFALSKSSSNPYDADHTMADKLEELLNLHKYLTVANEFLQSEAKVKENKADLNLKKDRIKKAVKAAAPASTPAPAEKPAKVAKAGKDKPAKTELIAATPDLMATQQPELGIGIGAKIDEVVSFFERSEKAAADLVLRRTDQEMILPISILHLIAHIRKWMHVEWTPGTILQVEPPEETTVENSAQAEQIEETEPAEESQEPAAQTEQPESAPIPAHLLPTFNQLSAEEKAYFATLDEPKRGLVYEAIKRRNKHKSSMLKTLTGTLKAMADAEPLIETINADVAEFQKSERERALETEQTEQPEESAEHTEQTEQLALEEEVEPTEPAAQAEEIQYREETLAAFAELSEDKRELFNSLEEGRRIRMMQAADRAHTPWSSFNHMISAIVIERRTEQDTKEADVAAETDGTKE